MFRHPVDVDDRFGMMFPLTKPYHHVIWGICVINAHSDAPRKARLACELRIIRSNAIVNLFAHHTVGRIWSSVSHQLKSAN